MLNVCGENRNSHNAEKWMAVSKIENNINRERQQGTWVSILSYNSAQNTFIAPSDGYICVQCWNFDNSSLSLWFNKTVLEIKMTADAKSFIVFAVRGSVWHCTGSGSGRSATFYPMI